MTSKRFITLFLTLFALAGFAQVDAYVTNEFGELYAIDMETCTSTNVGTVSDFIVPLDLAYSPDGTLYGISGWNLYSINTTTAEATFIANIFSLDSWTSMVCDENGLVYLAGIMGDLTRYNVETGETVVLGNSGVAAAGDIAFVDGNLLTIGTLINGGNGTAVYSTDLQTFETTEVVSGVGFNSFGIFTVADDCTNYNVFITSENDIDLVDIMDNTIEEFCANVVSGTSIYGAATTSEFITSSENCTGIDLDDDNSSGVAGNDFLADNQCDLVELPIGDEDVQIHTFDDMLDSLHIFFLDGILDAGEEIISVPDNTTYTIINNNSEDVWVINGENEPLDVIEGHIHETLYQNTSSTPSFGQRQVGVVGYSDEFVSDTAIAFIDIYFTPEIGTLNDLVICEGEAATFTISGNAESWAWNGVNGDNSLVVSQAGNYEVVGSIGPCSASANADLIVNPQPEVNVIDQVIDCEGGPVTVDVTAVGEIDWWNGSSSESLSIGESGTFSVSATNDCGTATDEVEVILVEFPEALLLESAKICAGDSVEITPFYTEGDFLWSTEETTPSIWISETGVYTVTIDHFGCIASDEITATFAEDVAIEDLLIPNVFSPNQDDHNAWLRPIKTSNPDQFLCGLEGVEVQLEIYNRWGNLIADLPCKWEGLYENGEPVPGGTYYYILTLESCAADREQVHGHVKVLTNK